MDLPRSLQWIEVDKPEIMDEKERALQGEQPRCAVERVRLDLADVDARRALFARLASRLAGGRRAMIVTEGLLIYLSTAEVLALAEDLSAQPAFQRWATDLCSPGLLRMMQKKMGKVAAAGGAPFQFAPPEGPLFFGRFGWKPLQVHSFLKVAAKHRRLPLFLRLLALLPDPRNGVPGPNRPWGGMILLGRS